MIFLSALMTRARDCGVDLRQVPAWAVLPVLLAVSAFGQERVVVLPAPGSPGAGAVYGASPFVRLFALPEIPGALTAVQGASADRIFVVSNGEMGSSVTTVSAGAAEPDPIALETPAFAAKVTPDGKTLLVLTSYLEVIDITGPKPVHVRSADVGFGVLDFDVSLDSKRVFAVDGFFEKLVVLDLVDGSISNTNIPVAFANAVAVGPNGMVYAVGSEIVEVNPESLQVPRRFSLPANSVVTRPAFTADGKFLAVGNSWPGGASGYGLDIATGTVKEFPAGPVLDQLTMVGPRQFIAISLTDGGLHRGDLATMTVVPATFSGAAFQAVEAIAASAESPSPKSLFVGAAPTVRIDLQSGAAAGQADEGPVVSAIGYAAAGTVASLAYASAPLTVPPQSISMPLVVRALGPGGEPLAGATVAWESANMTPVSVMTATSLDGFAQGIFRAPVTPGTYTVIARSGGREATFTVQVGGTAPPPDDGNGGSGDGSGGGSDGGGPTGPPGAAVAMISGNGQLVSIGTVSAPLVAEARDSAGKPVPGAKIVWSILGNAGTGSLSAAGIGQCQEITFELVCVADANGRSSAQFKGEVVVPGFPFVSYRITAASGEAKAVFAGTALDGPVAHAATSPAVVTVTPSHAPAQIRAAAGQTLAKAIQVVVSIGSQPVIPIPNVALDIRMRNDAPTLVSVACAGGAPLTSANGLASCDLVVGPKLGSAELDLKVGGTITLPSVALTVVPGVPKALVVIAGDRQSAETGKPVPQRLVVEARDAGGNPVPAVAVSWEAESGGLAVLPDGAATDPYGRASARVTAGLAAGEHKIKVTVGEAVARFTVSVAEPVAGLLKIAGDAQSAPSLTAFASPLTVQVMTAAGPAPGVRVAFAVESGVATLSQLSAVTDAAGQASTTVTTGAGEGPIRISAAAGSLKVVFELSCRKPAPELTAASFLNAASLTPGVAFGAMTAIRAPGLTVGLEMPAGTCVSGGNAGSSMPTTLAGIEVQFSSLPAPIFSVCRGSDGVDAVTVQAPFELAPATIPVYVRTGMGTAAQQETVVEGVEVAAAAPGLFERDSGGALIASAVRPDGSAVSESNPARRGEVVRVFATGLGPVLPWVGTNQTGSPGQRTFFRPVVTLGEKTIDTVSAQYAENLIGVFAISFVVPEDAPQGAAVPLALSIIDGERAYSSPASRIPVM